MMGAEACLGYFVSVVPTNGRCFPFGSAMRHYEFLLNHADVSETGSSLKEHVSLIQIIVSARIIWTQEPHKSSEYDVSAAH